MTEIYLPENEIIVSKTDPKSHITYCNEMFIDISGYKESELLGQPHNIIRHADMPQSVFSLLWSTLKSQQEFLGLVKNRCKNGDYYWAFANITPSYNSSKEVVGYYSVRRKPPQSMIDKFASMYKQMLHIESQSAGNKEEGIKQSLAFLLGEISEYGEDYDDALLKLFNQ